MANRLVFLFRRIGDMPRAELVASALLQLKNNPGLFEQWREMQGYTFKADGQMFSGTHWR